MEVVQQVCITRVRSLYGEFIHQNVDIAKLRMAKFLLVNTTKEILYFGVNTDEFLFLIIKELLLRQC